MVARATELIFTPPKRKVSLPNNAYSFIGNGLAKDDIHSYILLPMYSALADAGIQIIRWEMENFNQ